MANRCLSYGSLSIFIIANLSSLLLECLFVELKHELDEAELFTGNAF